MKLGQISIINFLSRYAGSIIGFVATIYITRVLGSEPFGVYNVVIGLVSFFAIFAQVGISSSIAKRVSEGYDQAEYAIAGSAGILIMFIIISSVIFLFQDKITGYVGYSATIYIFFILFLVLTSALIDSLLTGFHLVHISGLLSPLRNGSRAIAQVMLIFFGGSITALLIGHAIGFVVVIIIGGYFVFREFPSLSLPSKVHFNNLGDFAKFSWIGGIQSRMFSYTDIIILQLFVSSSLVGIYSAAWRISEFLILFSGALGATLFPEISSISADEGSQAVSRVVEQSLVFSGLFLIPGLFGGILLGGRILRIYGPEFPQGSLILSVLIAANLFMGYQNQLLNTLNAIDRPDITFRVNVMFVVANVTLNLVLVYLFGWLGAAVATATSIMISLIHAYYHMNKIIDFEVPLGEILRQWIAAVVMASVVYASLQVENMYHPIGHNFAVVIILVTVGACVYFTTLLGLSQEFRDTVDRNTPVDLPLVSS